MTDELKKRLDSLRAVAPRLNKVTDEATRIVSQVEKVLTEELHLGIACDVCFEYHKGKDPAVDSDGDEVEWANSRSLAFGRVNGIHVLEERHHKSDDGSCVGRYDVLVSEERTPWPSCDRETKLQAFAKLPQLLDEIFKKAGELAKTAEETASTVKEMLGQNE